MAGGSAEQPVSAAEQHISQHTDSSSAFVGYMGYVANTNAHAVAASSSSATPALTVTTSAAATPVVSSTRHKTAFERKKPVKIEPPDLPLPQPKPVEEPKAVEVQESIRTEKKDNSAAKHHVKQEAGSTSKPNVKTGRNKVVSSNGSVGSEKAKKTPELKASAPETTDHDVKTSKSSSRAVEKQMAKERKIRKEKKEKKLNAESKLAASSLNVRAKTLAEMDREIAELEASINRRKAEREKIKASNNAAESEPYDPSLPSVDDSEHSTAEARETGCSSPGYKPTPIAQLEANAVISKVLVSAAYKPKRKGSPVLPEIKKKIPKKKSAKMVDLFSVPSAAAEPESASDDELPLPKVHNSTPSTSGIKQKHSAPPTAADDGLSTEEEEQRPQDAMSSDVGQNDSESATRRRTAHANAVPARVSVQKGHIPSAKQQFNNRYANLQQEKQRLLQEAAKRKSAAPEASMQHRENAVAATNPKGEKRVAHEPKMTAQAQLALERPRIPALSNSKIAREVRQKYLDIFINECLKKTDDHQAAFKLAEQEERDLFSRTQTQGGYQSGAVNVLKRLRATPALNTDSALVLSHDQVLYGKALAQGNITVKDRSQQPVFDINSLDDKHLYELLLDYTLTGEQLLSNGYPYFDIDGTCAIQTDDVKKRVVMSDSDFRRVCVRCGAEYRLTEDGEYEKDEECEYHWGKSWKRKVAGAWDNRWSCCQSDITVKGCCFADKHVTDAFRASDMLSFVQSQPAAEHTNYKVYGLDCEMVYTVWGSSLARISLVSRNLTPVLDVLVRPEHSLVDCNSRFSGLRPDELLAAEHDFEQARAAFLELVTDDTILVGHSLESDLRSLRVVHERCIDTSVLFPHRLGPPYKRALKTLMAEHMKKIIQEDVFGHDSNEDAAAAMELVFFKLKEDQKLKHK